MHKIPSTKPKSTGGKMKEAPYKSSDKPDTNNHMTPQSKSYKVTQNKSRKSA